MQLRHQDTVNLGIGFQRGAWAVNRICSGSIKKGIPSGRITVLAGESSTGKTLIAATIIGNAIKDGCKHVFYFDAEGGADKKFFKNAGCDVTKIEQVLVKNVEDAQVKILDTFNMITEYKEKDPDARFMCVLDSLGALVSPKVFKDAEKDKVTSEMGGRAKLVNNMMKAVTIPCLISDTPFLVINHVYDDPASMYPSKIKNQGGGKGIQYMGALNIQCSRKLEKNEAKDADTFYGQTKLTFFTIKNRLVRPSLECDIWLDFKKGFVRQFESLFEEAERGGFIVCPKQGYYTVPSWTKPETMFRKAYLCSNASKDVWATFLGKFDEWSQNDLAYKELNQDIDDAEDEINDAIDDSDDIDNVPLEKDDE